MHDCRLTLSWLGDHVVHVAASLDMVLMLFFINLFCMYSHPVANRCLKELVNGTSWENAMLPASNGMSCNCGATQRYSSANFELHRSAVVWACVERAQPALLAAAARAHLQGQARQCIPCEAGVALLLARL